MKSSRRDPGHGQGKPGRRAERVRPGGQPRRGGRSRQAGARGLARRRAVHPGHHADRRSRQLAEPAGGHARRRRVGGCRLFLGGLRQRRAAPESASACGWQRSRPEAKFHHSSHTLERILRALERVFKGAEAAKRAKLRIADYIVLDAVIGNTDRHHENWGILRRRVGARVIGTMAPSFDHASALGRELLDERRKRRLEADGVGRYAEKGRGGIFWTETEKRAPSPLALVRCAARTHPELLLPALGRLEPLDEPAVRAIVDRVPADWMSPLARRFAIALVLYNLGELRGLVS